MRYCPNCKCLVEMVEHEYTDEELILIEEVCETCHKTIVVSYILKGNPVGFVDEH